MEYASRGDLCDYHALACKLFEPIARAWFRQLVSAVQYCHQKGSGTGTLPFSGTRQNWAFSSSRQQGHYIIPYYMSFECEVLLKCLVPKSSKLATVEAIMPNTGMILR
ncbi:MAP/microtubule affinity-regulating kinase 3-like isoform 8 [Anopheles sinensis]|uniref:MAP/microtubule affinity-regulating kinase 3-like isoform 8 n=1 Tax=Anopheles sinensis TaxID=74873 RepID=A0A084VAS8_ANOSI|nr:MAP/microtubule affinity-regulating kinase 3-like isoform 8 [Anopheles sinensis]